MVKGAHGGREQASVTELASRLALSQSSVTELIDRSVAAGLVVRVTSSEDRRVVLVRLTDEGERRLAATVAGLRADRAALRAALGEAALAR